LPDKRFETWWSGFEQRTREAGAHEIAHWLRGKLRRTRVVERGAFLRDLWEVLLQRRRDYGVALFLLDALTDPEGLRELAGRLSPLPDLQSADEEAHLADLMRVLAAAGDSGLLPPVAEYLLERPMSPEWTTVPWALWPHQKELFALAWQRYLRETQPADWTDALIVESFLAEPDAVRILRSKVASEHPEHWDVLRNALIDEADQVGWLSREQRASLDRAVL
jgi:hypothetical protein